MRLTSEQVLAHMRSGDATTARGVLEHFVSLFRSVVVASSGRAGCAIAGVTIDIAHEEDDLLAVARDAFQSWVSLLAAQLELVGVAATKAHGVSVMAVAGVEGGLILCRAEGSELPLCVIQDELLALLADPLPVEGGDPACWAGLVCEGCGLVLSEGLHRPSCPATR
jgi:TetR/AcrR family transcriptional regulator, lmrAB and yxaGH operons repressor